MPHWSTKLRLLLVRVTGGAPPVSRTQLLEHLSGVWAVRPRALRAFVKEVAIHLREAVAAPGDAPEELEYADVEFLLAEVTSAQADGPTRAGILHRICDALSEGPRRSELVGPEFGAMLLREAAEARARRLLLVDAGRSLIASTEFFLGGPSARPVPGTNDDRQRSRRTTLETVDKERADNAPTHYNDDLSPTEAREAIEEFEAVLVDRQRREDWLAAKMVKACTDLATIRSPMPEPQVVERVLKASALLRRVLDDPDHALLPTQIQQLPTPAEKELEARQRLHQALAAFVLHPGCTESAQFACFCVHGIAGLESDDTLRFLTEHGFELSGNSVRANTSHYVKKLAGHVLRGPSRLVASQVRALELRRPAEAVLLDVGA